ncbi:MAG: glycosyltransferase family 1 protein, partial [Anaerolineae bacterium]|nr:glycosyltransferase family 1 protein [Anaerolineae bacterium]
MTATSSTRPLNIGFVSTRFSGTDGVSLEAEKWAGELEEMGHTCFYFSGESDRPAERSHVAPEAFFQHPAIAAINDIAFEEPWGRQDLLELLNTSIQGAYNENFSQYIRPPRVTKRIRELADHLKQGLYAFVQAFEIELFVIENALTIPMNIPLGLAITEVIAETGMPTIAHHHDFYWERQRYLVNCVTDYLKACFPPTLPSIQHVVISSWAARQLSLNAGVSATVIPNVMDFDHPPETPDGYLAPLRADLGLSEDELLILQPTRVVQRKGLEHAIELVKR